MLSVNGFRLPKVEIREEATKDWREPPLVSNG